MDGSKQTTVPEDHRHLLQPSRPTSVYSTATIAVSDQTPTQSTLHLPSGSGVGAPQTLRATDPTPYRGFPSREAYLSALTAFAQERTYFKPDSTLVGFYGTKTMDDYIREGKAARRVSQADVRAMRRSTLPDLHTVVEGMEAGTTAEGGGRRKSLAQLGRRVLGKQNVA